jgi:primary-amine oxidase
MYNGVHGSRIPFNGRFPDRVRNEAIDTIVAKTMSEIADITLDLCGFAYYGSGDDRSNASYFVQNPSSSDGSNAIIWTPWRISGMAPYDRPSDLYVSFDISGTDPSLYFMRMIVYNLQVYNSTEEFRAAWQNPDFVKSPAPSPDGAFLKKDRKGPIRDLEQRFAPTSLELDGKRYKVDHENRYVEYLGWSFYTRYSRDTGISFFDVKYKGERVLYELALQGLSLHRYFRFRARLTHYRRYCTVRRK